MGLVTSEFFIIKLAHCQHLMNIIELTPALYHVATTLVFPNPQELPTLTVLMKTHSPIPSLSSVCGHILHTFSMFFTK